MSFRSCLYSAAAAVLTLTLFTGCSSIMPETVNSDDSITVQAAPDCIASLLPEIDSVAAGYDDDAILTEVEAVFEGSEQLASEEGTITFTYFSAIPSESRVTTTTILYNMEEESVYRVSSTESSQYFCTTETEPVTLGDSDPVSATFDSLFETVRSDESFNSKLSGTNVKLTFDYTTNQVELSLL